MNEARTIVTGRVAAIFDAGGYPDFDPACFDASDWHVDRSRAHAKTGRAGVRMRKAGGETWVRRHYHRGGAVSRFLYDRYYFSGVEESRPFREFRLLAKMRELGLPVPAPVAGRIVRGILTYRADLITVLLPATRPLSSDIAAAAVTPAMWPRIGRMLARFHDAGVDHPDLTAHNILVDADSQTHLLDFDNAKLRPDGRWKEAGLMRLKRSLNKVAMETGTSFDEAAWTALLDAYRGSA